MHRYISIEEDLFNVETSTISNKDQNTVKEPKICILTYIHIITRVFPDQVGETHET